MLDGSRLEEHTVQRIIVVANRLPVSWDGEQWTISPGGLVRALRPVLQEADGAWVGWPGIPDFAPDPFSHSGIDQRPVPLSEDEVDSFYYGFCNGTLWPLYHDAIVPPEYHRHTWKPYVAVNRRYAEETAAVLEPGDIAWVQDYQLQLVPSMIRAMRPGVTIGFYLHIPFPPIEIFARLPWRRQIIEGLLGSDVIAFQTRQSASNFARAARRFAGAEAIGRRDLRWNGRAIHLQSAPIAIDTGEFERMARSPAVRQRAAELRSELGDPDHVILGMDRLDYTKGIDLRLKAFAGLLEGTDRSHHEYAFVQVAVPSREQVPAYQDLRTDIEQLVGRINGEYGEPGWSPISYLYRTLPFEEVIASYVAADVMLVTPLRDGMNLVAKEYVASRVEGDGVLVLSEFAGAAEQLRSALIVNPYDVDAVANTIAAATAMPRAEQRSRMRKLQRAVRKSDVFDWADQCLAPLENR
ncbi:MAG: trehalose-6-phosphate synthase [Actinomycetota bacterium]|nr:trehalose-6-phosphate synthase [Actinomycetota bacterium]